MPNQAHGHTKPSTDDYIVIISKYFNENNSKEMNELSTDWKQWKCQHDIYSDIKSYSEFNAWKKSDLHLKKYLENIAQTLQAMKEVKLIEAFSEDDKQEINFHLMLILKRYIARIEISQLKRIHLNEDIPRDKEIAKKYEQFRKNLYDLEQTLTKKNHSSQLDQDTYPSLYALLKNHERFSIHFKYHMDKLLKLKDATSIPSTAYSVFSTITHALPGILSMSQAIGSFLSAIPVINAVVIALPLAYQAMKSWIKDQSPLKKLGATGIFVLVLGGIITAGLLPIAAAGIAAGLVGFGVVFNNIIPWWKSHKEVNACKNEIANINPDNINSFSLQNWEKNNLLRKLEDYLLSHVNDANYPSTKEINKAKKCISDGSLTAISQDAVLKLAINKQDMKNFRTQSANEYRKALNDKLTTLTDKRNTNIKNMVTGITGFVGAILLCIPFPPTMILGISLIAASSIAGLAIKYEVFSKIKNFFVGLFSKKTVDAPEPPSESVDNLIKNDMKHSSEYTIEHTIKQPPDISKKATEVNSVVKTEDNSLSPEWKNNKKPAASNIKFSLSGQRNPPANDPRFGNKPPGKPSPKNH